MEPGLRTTIKYTRLKIQRSIWHQILDPITEYTGSGVLDTCTQRGRCDPRGEGGSKGTDGFILGLWIVTKVVTN